MFDFFYSAVNSFKRFQDHKVKEENFFSDEELEDGKNIKQLVVIELYVA